MLCRSTQAQSFPIGIVDVFGNRKLTKEQVLQHLGYKTGDSLSQRNFRPDSIIAELKKTPGVAQASIEAVCCDSSGRLMLFAGIAEDAKPSETYRAAPTGDIRLTDTMIAVYHDFIRQNQEAPASGQNTEDDSHGYALGNFKPVRDDQQQFIIFAAQHLALLSNTLRHSKSAEHRAVAAEIIAYSPERKQVVDNLLFAAADPDETVRNNAIRALGVLSDYLDTHKELHIIIDGRPFIAMLNSIVWTDRNKSGLLLQKLSKNRDPRLLKQLRVQALPSLREMAAWNDRSHALPYFIILGRMAGIDDGKLYEQNFSKDWPGYLDGIIARL